MLAVTWDPFATRFAEPATLDVSVAAAVVCRSESVYGPVAIASPIIAVPPYTTV
jgi:hypothetical protein